MKMFRSWISRASGLFRKEQMDCALDEELASHLAMHVEDNLRAGMTAEEARRDALIKLGGVEQTKEAVRDNRGWPMLESLMRDVRFSARLLWKKPVFTFVAVLTLALGIGANSTIFAMVSRFVLHPAPVGDPATLMALHTTQQNECCNGFSWPLYTDVRDNASSFSGVTGYHELVPASIGGSGDPQREWGEATTTNFFDVAALQMTLGRGFRSDEEKLSVIVLGYRVWKGRFNSDPGIVGKAIMLSGRPFTVVGVAPPLFRGFDLVLDCQFWVPLGTLDLLVPNESHYDSRLFHWIEVAGRLKPGVTRGEAAAELKVLAQRLGQAHPDTDKDLGFRFEQAGSLPPRHRNFVLMFLGSLSIVVLLVLCIACANVANLLLAQAAGRQREMAIRVALGATRGQLLRQVMTESVLLALGGGILGVAISAWATRGLSAFRFPAPVPFDLSIGVDAKVFLYAFLLSLATGLLFGLLPAWTAAWRLPSSALKGEDLLARPGRFWTLRNFLVVAQISMSLILLCATGLMLRSMQSAASMDIGFRSHGVLTMAVDPRLHGYTAQRTIQFLAELQRRVTALPGVSSAACTDGVPLSGGNRSDAFQVVGRATSGSEAEVGVDLYMVTPGYFETLGIPHVAGSDFGSESSTSPMVAVVNQAFVERLFRKENPIGQRVTGGGATYEIIGVVTNAKSRTLGEDLRPVLYRSLAQSVGNDPSLMGYSILVRTAGDSASQASAVRGEIRAMDPTLAVFGEETMEHHLREALFLPRLAGTLFGIFGIVGLLLAALGLYGVMSCTVSLRTREIGIRMALGAEAGGVQGMIVRQGMWLVLIALSIGLPAALLVAKLFNAILYGVRPHDLATFIAVPLFLAAVASLACWIPSRRAAMVEPASVLRFE
jgi:predicted permease